MKHKLLKLISKYRFKTPPSIDIRKLEQSNLCAISELEKKFIEHQISQVTVNHNDIDNLLSNVREIFNQNGIVIIKHFIEKNSVRECAHEINSLVNEYLYKMSDGDWYEDSLALVQKSGSRVKGIKNFVSNSKTLINIRQDQDSGMVDVFKPELISGSFKKINHIRISGLVSGVVNNGNNLSLTHINCYLNRSVNSTRGFHIDSLGMRIKAFLYMSDVLDFSDGPYVYVRGSHLDEDYRNLNALLSEHFRNKTDAPIVPIQNVVPVLAEAGTLVISDQSGVHRGYPQDSGGSRTIAVFNYN
jgi:hypothetical protein